MPPRRSRSNDLRAMDAYRRIHATLGERVVMPPDAPARERRPAAGRVRARDARRMPAAPGYLSLGSSRFRDSGRPRPAGPVLTATAVIAVLALMALAVGRLVVGSPSTPRASSTRTTLTPTTAAPHPRVHTAGAGAAARTGRTTTTTPTVLVPSASTAAGAAYVVTTAPFSVQVNTTGSCWMEVGPTSAGPFTFVGTVPAGQQKVFPASSRLWLRLGAPASVTVSVNGTPLQLTAPGSAPFNLTISAVGT
ncbi:MAG TPA: DUF4115 domain-containing protein [Acidimicrobiales bacterium]|nr:DUF4115 domain-containing protein [Acidimicrobiales bacterium]